MKLLQLRISPYDIWSQRHILTKFDSRKESPGLNNSTQVFETGDS